MSRASFRYFSKICGVLTIAVLTACTAPTPGAEFNDPYEVDNRSVHGFNKVLDTNVLRPAGVVANAVPVAITDPVSNFADNVSLPGMIANGLLQGDLKGTGTNIMRFVVNTTIGIGGLFDPASNFGLTEESTDFGETLAVWGVREGAYLELPVFGPSTERDAVGTIVDLFLDPLQQFGSQTLRDVSRGTNVADLAIQRGRFLDTIDGVLYDSADSYAQARTLYLQNRRFELGEEPDQTTMIDPFSTDLNVEGFEQ